MTETGARRPRVRVRARGSDRKLPYDLEDISESGLFIRTAAPRRVGERLQLDIAIGPWEKCLHVLGRVVRVVPSGPGAGMGVEFVGLDERSRAWLAELIPDLGAGRRRRRPGPLRAPRH